MSWDICKYDITGDSDLIKRVSPCFPDNPTKMGRFGFKMLDQAKTLFIYFRLVFPGDIEINLNCQV